MGDHVVRARIGEGGQAVVYLGVTPDGRRVAIKLLRPLPVGDARARGDAAARFVQEVEATKRVARFCTAQVLEVGQMGERPYIVSEYVDGPSLKRLVAERGPHGGAALERLAVGTATALAAIHRVGVVHRDFNPNNVLMAADGPRVIDFGLARALEATTTSGPVMGTPAYLAPEQLSGRRVTPAADVFAWAATVVYAATGRPPFEGATMAALLHQILRGRPRLDGVPGPLRDVLAVCLEKDPGRRPTARQIMDRLLTLAPDDPLATRMDNPLPLPGPAVAEETVAEIDDPWPVTGPARTAWPEPPPSGSDTRPVRHTYLPHPHGTPTRPPRPAAPRRMTAAVQVLLAAVLAVLVTTVVVLVILL
ncbi:serine/threonine-protein kinase [Thermomonospora umbrina]|uniref:serine/threonine-protein kinase n=1 Tax=Thermomonospora umbrina TaxID=111806 RepID=UPI0014774F92|nr:serine/threonine-protein kinase [Thermomonospora umbrina]